MDVRRDVELLSRRGFEREVVEFNSDHTTQSQREVLQRAIDRGLRACAEGRDDKNLDVKGCVGVVEDDFDRTERVIDQLRRPAERGRNCRRRSLGGQNRRGFVTSEGVDQGRQIDYAEELATEILKDVLSIESASGNVVRRGAADRAEFTRKAGEGQIGGRHAARLIALELYRQLTGQFRDRIDRLNEDAARSKAVGSEGPGNVLVVELDRSRAGLAGDLLNRRYDHVGPVHLRKERRGCRG